ncbi:MAG: hypothetical protein MMC33_005652 [Icmadophila ericetorum]|nr:hypothetical protein [Icmadophila ericetorum]
MERDTHTTSFYSRHPESHEQNANFSEFQVEGLNVRPSDPDPGVLADSRSMSPYWSELGSRFRQERDWQPSTMEATFPPYTREIFLTSACFEEEDQQTPEDLVQFGFGSGSNNPSTIQVHSSSSGNLINTPSSNSQLETPAPSDIVTQYQLRQSPPDTYPHYSANESYLSQNNLSLVISRAFGPVANTSSLCTQAEVEDLDVNEFMRKDLLLDRDLYAMGGAFYLTPRNVGMGHFFLSNDSIFRDMEMQNRYLVAGRPAENVDRRRYGVYTGYQSGIPSLEPNLADQENQSSIEVGNTSLSPGHEDVPVDISIEGLTEAQRLEHDAWGEPDPEFYEKMKRDSHELFGEG